MTDAERAIRRAEVEAARKRRWAEANRDKVNHAQRRRSAAMAALRENHRPEYDALVAELRAEHPKEHIAILYRRAMRVLITNHRTEYDDLLAVAR